MTAPLVTATSAHAEVMAFLHGRAFAVRDWGAESIELQLNLPGAFGWIAPAGGMILARVAADEAEVLTLAVDPAVQRRGVGRALLDQALDTARQRGANAIFLEVAAGNAPARALYLAAGFVMVACRRGYYPDGDDALVLRRPL